MVVQSQDDVVEKPICDMINDKSMEDVPQGPHERTKEVLFEDEDNLIEVMFNDDGDLVEVKPEDDVEEPVNEEPVVNNVDDIDDDISEDDEHDCCEMTFKQKQVLFWKSHFKSSYQTPEPFLACVQQYLYSSNCSLMSE
jgi:hypothetical protein